MAYIIAEYIMSPRRAAPAGKKKATSKVKGRKASARVEFEDLDGPPKVLTTQEFFDELSEKSKGSVRSRRIGVIIEARVVVELGVGENADGHSLVEELMDTIRGYGAAEVLGCVPIASE